MQLTSETLLVSEAGLPLWRRKVGLLYLSRGEAGSFRHCPPTEETKRVAFMRGMVSMSRYHLARSLHGDRKSAWSLSNTTNWHSSIWLAPCVETEKDLLIALCTSSNSTNWLLSWAETARTV